jgi:hypothetical protein
MESMYLAIAFATSTWALVRGALEWRAMPAEVRWSRRGGLAAFQSDYSLRRRSYYFLASRS